MERMYIAPSYMYVHVLSGFESIGMPALTVKGAHAYTCTEHNIRYGRITVHNTGAKI